MKILRNILKLVALAVAILAGMRVYRQKVGENSGIQDAQTSDNFNERQLRILKLAKSKKQLVMADLLKIFDGVTERTLRRDLSKLVELNKLGKEGHTKDVVYTSLN